MRLNAIIVVVVVLAIAGVTYWYQAKPPHAKPQMQAAKHVRDVPVSTAQNSDDILPDFTVTTLDGQVYQAADFNDKVLVINFWASWCLPCVAEFPKLLSVARDHREDMTLLLLSSDMDTESIDKFVGKMSEADQKVLQQDNVVMVWDDMQEVTAKVFGVSKLPETFIVKRDGRIVSKLIGANWEEEEITRHLSPEG